MRVIDAHTHTWSRDIINKKDLEARRIAAERMGVEPVLDSTIDPYSQVNITIIGNLAARDIPVLIVANKIDLKKSNIKKIQAAFPQYEVVGASAKYGNNIDEFPYDPTQWNDTDDDGYGDNLWGNNADLNIMDRGTGADVVQAKEDDTDGERVVTTLWIIVIAMLVAVIIISYLFNRYYKPPTEA